MTIDIHDPRLTAYVLGELDDAELREIDALLADDTLAGDALAGDALAGDTLAGNTLAGNKVANRAELRAAIAELRAASELLAAALGGGEALAEHATAPSPSMGLGRGEGRHESEVAASDAAEPLTRLPESEVAGSGQATAGSHPLPQGERGEHAFAGQQGIEDRVGRRRRRYVILALAAMVLVAIALPINEAIRSRNLAQDVGASGGETADFNSLIDLITSTIEPTSSEEVAGEGQIESYRNNLSLVITEEATTPSSNGPLPASELETARQGVTTWEHGIFDSEPVVEATELGALGGNGLDGRPATPLIQDSSAWHDRRGDQGGGPQPVPGYGYVAPGDANGNLSANGSGTSSLNRHGAVTGKPAAPGGQDSYELGVRLNRGSVAARDGRGRVVDALGDLMEGEVVDALDARESRLALNEAIALRPDLTPEAVKKLKELEQQIVEDPAHNTEAYARIYDNRFLRPLDAPLSTFSIDVDTASYANMRRFLRQGALPPADSVRIEELVNYFSYPYAPPAEPQDADKPFAVHTEVTACPWNTGHRLVRIALKGREVHLDARSPSNLVFLLDVSGSMDDPNKLPLVKRAMHLLVEKLGENDRVAIVVYAGASGLVLPSTTANNRETILAAIDNLTPGGSTNGASGIELAYQIAVANQIKEGVNRVILATDGDFNVGITNDGDLTRLIEDKAKSGVFLTVLGFGMGNLKDSTLERLADKGNGNYGYIDTENEARKLLVDQLSGTLITIAKDVKLQIEFNPARVAAYRLLGYENRLLAAEDFNDDTKDAGEIGAGHAVTAFYEIVPVAPPAEQAAAERPADQSADEAVDQPADAAADQPADDAAVADAPAEEAPPAETAPVDPLKYQRPAELTEAARTTPELLTLKLRYKEPDGATSKLLEFGVADADKPIGEASEETRFAASVALFGMLLRQSPHAGAGTMAAVLEMADSSRQHDEHGYRAEFVELVKQAMPLVKAAQPAE
ncbi:MAG: von Willebrand factor type A domain-containing protein [Pirellulales bacterium]